MKFRQTFVFFMTVICLNLSQVFGYTFQDHSKIEFIEKKLVSDEDGKSLFSWDTPLSLIASHHLATMSDEELDSDWKLNDFFGSIIVINLPRSKNRLEEVTNELSQINTKVFHIFPAIDGQQDLSCDITERFRTIRGPYDMTTEEGINKLKKQQQGDAGCYLSHYTNLKKVKLAFDQASMDLNLAIASNNDELIQKTKGNLKNYSRVLILEDDARFGFLNESGDISISGAGKILRNAMIDLPENWDMLYFMVHVRQPTEQTAPHLYKIGKSWSLCAYAVNYPMYDPLVEFLSAVEDPARPIKDIDPMISLLHQSHNVFAIYPSIVFNKGNTSEILGGVKRDFWQPQPIFTPPKKKNRL